MAFAAARLSGTCAIACSGVVTATVAALFAAVSKWFATVVAYVHLCVSDGPLAAALIVCAAYGVLAIAIWAIRVMRRRATRTRHCGSVGAGIIRRRRFATKIALAATGTPKDPLALIAAIRLGRELSTSLFLSKPPENSEGY